MQNEEVSDEDYESFQNDNVDEDDILYSCPREGYQPCSLLFIHQSHEQLQILKRYTV